MSEKNTEAVAEIREQVNNLESTLLFQLRSWEEYSGLSIRSIEALIVDTTTKGGPRQTTVAEVRVQIETPR